MLKSEHDLLPLSPSKKCHFQAADGHVEGTAGTGGGAGQLWGRAAVRLLTVTVVVLTGTLEPRGPLSHSLSKFNHCQKVFPYR